MMASDLKVQHDMVLEFHQSLWKKKTEVIIKILEFGPIFLMSSDLVKFNVP